MGTTKDITQCDMATFLGESQQYISKLISNKIMPRKKRLQKFAKRTNTDLAFWLISSGKEKEKAIKKAINNPESKATA